MTILIELFLIRLALKKNPFMTMAEYMERRKHENIALLKGIKKTKKGDK